MNFKIHNGIFGSLQLPPTIYLQLPPTILQLPTLSSAIAWIQLRDLILVAKIPTSDSSVTNMPPAKKTKRDASGKPDSADVYIVTRTIKDHGYGSETEIMGAYASPKIAAREAGSISTQCWGSFEDALDEFEHNYESYVEDNRHDPPSNGILLQCGSEDYGEGDFVRLEIKRLSIVSRTNLQIKERTSKDDSDDGSE